MRGFALGAVPGISEGRLCSTPAALKGNKAVLVCVRAPEIKETAVQLFGVLDGFPVKERHAAEVVIASIGAAILVIHSALVVDRNHGGNQLLALECHPDL